MTSRTLFYTPFSGTARHSTCRTNLCKQNCAGAFFACIGAAGKKRAVIVFDEFIKGQDGPAVIFSMVIVEMVRVLGNNGDRSAVVGGSCLESLALVLCLCLRGTYLYSS